MTIKALYPSVEPSLELDFANTKALDPRISFTRASTGTYVGADGLIKTAGNGVARFDHNPVTGESLGLLVEEARTNQTNYSQQFDNAVWIKSNATVTTNVVTAPDGTLTADQLIENTVSGAHGFSCSTPGATLNSTFSIYIKPAGRTRIYLYTYGAPNEAYFNLTGSGSVISGPGVIQAAGNGWYRCSVSCVTNSFNAFGLALVDTGVNFIYTGDGTSGVYLWGAQLEVGSFPTSYIPTVASAVTRAADVASMTGTNFSSWYNQSAGVFFAKYSRTPGGRVGIVTGLPNEYSWTAIADERGSRGFTTRFNGTEIFDNPSIPAGATIKQIGAYSFALSQSSLCVNGRTVLNSSHAQTNPTGITIGGGSNINYLCLNAPISQIYYWPARFSDATLQTLTQ